MNVPMKLAYPFSILHGIRGGVILIDIHIPPRRVKDVMATLMNVTMAP